MVRKRLKSGAKIALPVGRRQPPSAKDDLFAIVQPPLLWFLSNDLPPLFSQHIWGELSRGNQLQYLGREGQEKVKGALTVLAAYCALREHPLQVGVDSPQQVPAALAWSWTTVPGEREIAGVCVSDCTN